MKIIDRDREIVAQDLLKEIQTWLTIADRKTGKERAWEAIVDCLRQYAREYEDEIMALRMEAKPPSAALVARLNGTIDMQARWIDEIYENVAKHQKEKNGIYERWAEHAERLQNAIKEKDKDIRELHQEIDALNSYIEIQLRLRKVGRD